MYLSPQGKCIKRNQTYNLPFQTRFFISISMKHGAIILSILQAQKLKAIFHISHWSCTRIWGYEVSNKTTLW